MRFEATKLFNIMAQKFLYLLKEFYRLHLKKHKRKFQLFLYKTGKKKECYICGKKLRRIIKYRGGLKNVPLWIKKTDPVGNDFDNYSCPYCFSHDRERHLFMYFDKLKLWDKIRNSSVLHFAPETYLSARIEKCSPQKYVKADLNPDHLYKPDDNICKIDATNIPYDDSIFDFLLFNHILEHISDYKKALCELFRVLKPNGIAILQTPYSRLLHGNFEDEGICTNELRLFFYGQEDHVRIFSEKQFLKSLIDTGFTVRTYKHSVVLAEISPEYFGVNKEEDLITAIKPEI